MSMQDLALLGVSIVVLSITILIANGIMTGVQNNQALQQHDELGIINQSMSTVFPALDGIFIFFAFGSLAVIIVFAYYIRTHPALFVFALIMFAVIVVIIPQVANAFFGVASSPSITGLFTPSADYPLMLAFMQNISYIITVAGIIIMIVLYVRIRGGDDNAAI
jgi:hypothetical protein